MGLEIPSKPKGLLYLVFKLPRYLYRWHLGWLFGHRLLMITHFGRKSGLRRQNVLEVVRYTPSTRECIVIAGYGVKSDWFRNIQVRPTVEVQVGRQRYVPRQRLLSSEETLRLLEEYRQLHPRLLRGLMRIIGYNYDGTSQGLRALSQSLRVVAFRPE